MKSIYYKIKFEIHHLKIWIIRNLGLKGSFIWACKKMKQGYFVERLSDRYDGDGKRYKFRHRDINIIMVKSEPDELVNSVETIQSTEKWRRAYINIEDVMSIYWDVYNKYPTRKETGFDKSYLRMGIQV